jgi:hypothetical protein
MAHGNEAGLRSFRQHRTVRSAIFKTHIMSVMFAAFYFFQMLNNVVYTRWKTDIVVFGAILS